MILHAIFVFFLCMTMPAQRCASYQLALFCTADGALQQLSVAEAPHAKTE